MEELKKLLEAQKQAFEELKSENNKGRNADKEVLAKIQTAIDDAEKRYEKARQEQKAQADEIERKLNKLSLGGSAGDDEKAKALATKSALFGWLRGRDPHPTPDQQKALVISNDTGGGYLATTEMSMDIIKAEVLFSPVRQLVTVQAIGTGELQQPKRTGTASATRVGETETRSETTTPTWGMMKIPAPELYAEARVTWANLEDSAFDLEAIIRDEFAEQFGVKEGTEFVSGNGVNQMLGILDANAAGPSTPIAYTASTQAATIAGAAAGAAGQGDPLVNLFHAVKTAYARNGTWILNRGSLGKVRLLKDTTGAYLWQPGLQPGNPGTILGAPYVECPDMPDEGANAYPIAFGDFKRAYRMVDRVGLTITRDPYTLASSGQVKIFGRRRVGGQVVLGEAIRLLKCAVS